MSVKRNKSEPTTVRELIALSYSLLGRADAALCHGAQKYAPLHHIIKAKLQRGLLDGSMKMRSLYDDEKLKMTVPQACYYCGSVKNLCADHLIPKMKGGPDSPENLICACRSCNSSKGAKDMLAWMRIKNRFPPILLLRRYMKIVAKYCDVRGILDMPLDELDDVQDMPFDLRLLPTEFPPLHTLKRWIYPPETQD